MDDRVVIGPDAEVQSVLGSAPMAGETKTSKRWLGGKVLVACSVVLGVAGVVLALNGSTSSSESTEIANPGLATGISQVLPMGGEGPLVLTGEATHRPGNWVWLGSTNNLWWNLAGLEQQQNGYFKIHKGMTCDAIGDEHWDNSDPSTPNPFLSGELWWQTKGDGRSTRVVSFDEVPGIFPFVGNLDRTLVFYNSLNEIVACSPLKPRKPFGIKALILEAGIQGRVILDSAGVLSWQIFNIMETLVGETTIQIRKSTNCSNGDQTNHVVDGATFDPWVTNNIRWDSDGSAQGSKHISDLAGAYPLAENINHVVVLVNNNTVLGCSPLLQYWGSPYTVDGAPYSTFDYQLSKTLVASTQGTLAQVPSGSAYLANNEVLTFELSNLEPFSRGTLAIREGSSCASPGPNHYFGATDPWLKEGKWYATSAGSANGFVNLDSLPGAYPFTANLNHTLVVLDSNSVPILCAELQLDSEYGNIAIVGQGLALGAPSPGQVSGEVFLSRENVLTWATRNNYPGSFGTVQIWSGTDCMNPGQALSIGNCTASPWANVNWSATLIGTSFGAVDLRSLACAPEFEESVAKVVAFLDSSGQLLACSTLSRFVSAVPPLISSAQDLLNQIEVENSPTAAPTSAAPTTATPTIATAAPTTKSPTLAPTTKPPTTPAPTTTPPTTTPPTTTPPTTTPPTTPAPTTKPPTTAAPTTAAPTTKPPTKSPLPEQPCFRFCPSFSEQTSAPGDSCLQCECLPGFVRAGTECVRDGSATCAGMTLNQDKTNRENIVLVPSGFGTDMDSYQEIAWRIFQYLRKYDPLNPDKVEQLNIWMGMSPINEDNPSTCAFNCSGIERLLCCEIVPAFDLARTTCGLGYGAQVLVVHNDAQYGGAGGSISTVSSHELAPQVAAHEFGHSIFNLADEYVYGTGTNFAPNCDVAGCSKWADLIDKGEAQCLPGKCRNGEFYSSFKSIMEVLDFPFGAVNERVSCCHYLDYPGAQPEYCNKFDNLIQKCTEVKPFQISSRANAKSSYFFETPVLYTAALSDQGKWEVLRSEALSPGNFDAKIVVGDWATAPQSLPVKVKRDGSTIATFASEDRFKIPVSHDDSENNLGEFAWIPRKMIQVIVDVDEIDTNVSISFELPNHT